MLPETITKPLNGLAYIPNFSGAGILQTINVASAFHIMRSG